MSVPEQEPEPPAGCMVIAGLLAFFLGVSLLSIALSKLLPFLFP